jgi:hypothetical protein
MFYYLGLFCLIKMSVYFNFWNPERSLEILVLTVILSAITKWIIIESVFTKHRL